MKTPRKYPQYVAALPTVYRQRFTTAGWWGLAMSVVGPAIAGGAYLAYVDALSPYRRDYSEFFAIIGVGNILFYAGVVMMFINREYYPYTPPAVPSEPAPAQDDDDDDDVDFSKIP